MLAGEGKCVGDFAHGAAEDSGHLFLMLALAVGAFARLRAGAPSTDIRPKFSRSTFACNFGELMHNQSRNRSPNQISSSEPFEKGCNPLCV